MRRSITFWATLLAVLLAGPGLMAQADRAKDGKEAKKGEGVKNGDEAKTGEAPGPSPEEVTTGEIRLLLSSDYAKVRLDGEEWEEHEFLDNGKTLVLHAVKRTDEHRVALSPIYADLAPLELSIKPDEWKLATVGKKIVMWRAEKKIVFTKKTTTPPAKEPPPPATPPK